RRCTFRAGTMPRGTSRPARLRRDRRRSRRHSSRPLAPGPRRYRYARPTDRNRLPQSRHRPRRRRQPLSLPCGQIFRVMSVKENGLQSSSQSDRQWLTAIFLVALLATAVVAPMFFLGNASGHDFQPHVAGWIEAAGQWREGILFHRWARWAHYVFCESRFIFYLNDSRVFEVYIIYIMYYTYV